ncbi:MAG: HNH endonuclease signature motif containing protein, partial [Mycobacteriales bacterium]
GPAAPVYPLVPAELAGLGPIEAATAARLACDARWARLVTDPVDGRLLDAGVARREPSGRTRRYLVARDDTCRFPGCAREANRCDAHHLTCWSAGGRTDRENLVMLCRRHHQAVHEGGWRTSGNPESTLTWTSPAGQSWQSRPRTFPATRAAELPVQPRAG